MFEQDGIDLIGQDGAQLLAGIVRDAWSDLHTGRVGVFTLTRRTDMNELMVQGANQILLDLEFVHLYLKDTTHWFVWRDTAAIRFKHHRADGLTTNHSSGAQSLIEDQKPLPGLPEDLIFLSCGPVLDRTESSISQILLTKRIGKKNEWAIDLDQLAEGDTMPFTSPLPITPKDAPTGATILPFRPAKKKGEK
jgi:hypothetical protein